MRSLTPEELAKAPARAARFWRSLWLRCAFLPAIVFLFALAAYRDHPVLVVWGFGPALIIFVPAAITLWRHYRKWKDDFATDLRESVAEEKRGRVYDRFSLRHLFAATIYLVWADNPDLGLELLLDRSEFEKTQVGDTVQADYLPRTGLVVAVRKLSS